jgi:hypothetical protein
MGSRVISGVLCVCLGACDWSPPAPTEPTSEVISFVVTFEASPGDPFSADLNGTTFNTPGAFPVSMRTGTYEVSGTLLGPGLRIHFSQEQGGGVRTGSVQALGGPGAQTEGCMVAWRNTFPRPQPIRAIFTVALTGSLCYR